MTSLYKIPKVGGSPLVGGANAVQEFFLIRPIIQPPNRSGATTIQLFIQNVTDDGYMPGVGGYRFFYGDLGWVEWDIPALEPGLPWKLMVMGMQSPNKGYGKFFFDSTLVFTDLQAHHATATTLYADDVALPTITERKPHKLRVQVDGKVAASTLHGLRLYEMVIYHD